MANHSNRSFSSIPTERVAQLKQRDEDIAAAKKAHEERLDILRSAAAQVAKTPEGLAFLQHLASICGRNKSKLSSAYAPGVGGGRVLTSVNPEATIVHAAREEIWLELRKLFEYDQLIEIERE